MSACLEIQNAVAARLREPGRLRLPVPVLARRKKHLENEIAAAVQAHGLCLQVMPPLPTRAMDDIPFPFFEEAELAILILEDPSRNRTGVEAEDLLEDAAQALHWSFPEALMGTLQHPLALARDVCSTIPLPGQPNQRCLALRLGATYQPSGAAIVVAESAELEDPFEDLQKAVAAQLAANLPEYVRVLTPKDQKELESRVAVAAGDHVLSVKVERVVPKQAMQGVPSIFYQAAEVRVQVSEQPSLNRTETDVFDLIELTARALHWQELDGRLAEPLRLQRTCTRDAWDPKQPGKLKFDVLFEAAFGRIEEE